MEGSIACAKGGLAIEFLRRGTAGPGLDLDDGEALGALLELASVLDEALGALGPQAGAGDPVLAGRVDLVDEAGEGLGLGRLEGVDALDARADQHLGELLADAIDDEELGHGLPVLDGGG